jgi:sporulation protein YlmC with PRC-barrel domain
MKPVNHKISPIAKTSLLALMIGLGPAAATAQTGGDRNQTNQTNQTQTGAQRGSTNASNMQDQSRSDLSRHHGKDGKRLGDINGKDVHNRQGEKLGTISDVVIDTRSGDASHVIVNHGGVLGMGQRSRAVPTGALSYQATANDGDKRLVLDMDSARWNQAPAFDRARLDDLSAREQQDRLDQFYGTSSQNRNSALGGSSAHNRDMNRDSQTGMTGDTTHRTTPGMNPSDRGQTGETGTGATGLSGTTGQTGVADAQRNQNQTNTRDQNRTGANSTTGTGGTSGVGMSGSQSQTRQLALASDIKGKTLRSGDQEVGSIEDIVIHMEQRKASALVDPANNMIDGDDKFLVPFTRIDRAGDDRYTTTLTRQDFDGARTGSAGSTSLGGGDRDRIQRWSDEHGSDKNRTY